MIWLFNFFALALIVAIVWWFWLSKPKPRQSGNNGTVEIIVENGVYTPSVIEAKKGTKLVLAFIRNDPSPCAEKVVFSDFDISHDLPLNQESSFELALDKAGVFEFTCQMGMYRGKLIVS